MPLLHRKPFMRQKPPADLSPDEEVFLCKATHEIFRTYDEFFERTILCNSLVWSCSLTKRPGLTYQEAVDSEKQARQNLQSFPSALVLPLLHLASLTRRSHLSELCEDVYDFAKKRYFPGEIVDVTGRNGVKCLCEILEVLSPSSCCNGLASLTTVANGNGKQLHNGDTAVISDSDEDTPSLQVNSKKIKSLTPSVFRYKVKLVKADDSPPFVTIGKQIKRKKNLRLSREILKLLLKQHCEKHSGILRLKPSTVSKFNLSDQTFSQFFPDEPPHFPCSPQAKGRGHRPGLSSPGPEKRDNTISSAKKWDDTMSYAKKRDVTMSSVKKRDDTMSSANKRDGTMSSAKKRDVTMSSVKKRDDTMSSAKKRDDTMSSAKKRDGTMSSAKKRDGTMSSAKKRDVTMSSVKKRDDTMSSAKKRDVTMSSVKKRDDTMSSAKKRDVTMSSAKKRDGTMSSAKKRDGTMSSAKKRDVPMSSAKNRDDTMSSDKKRDDTMSSVSSAKKKDDTMSATKKMDDTMSSAKKMDDTMSSAKKRERMVLKAKMMSSVDNKCKEKREKVDVQEARRRQKDKGKEERQRELKRRFEEEDPREKGGKKRMKLEEMEQEKMMKVPSAYEKQRKREKRERMKLKRETKQGKLMKMTSSANERERMKDEQESMKLVKEMEQNKLKKMMSLANEKQRKKKIIKLKKDMKRKRLKEDKKERKKTEQEINKLEKEMEREKLKEKMMSLAHEKQRKKEELERVKLEKEMEREKLKEKMISLANEKQRKKEELERVKLEKVMEREKLKEEKMIYLANEKQRKKEEQERIKLEKEMERNKLKEDEKERKKEEQQRIKRDRELEREKLKEEKMIYLANEKQRKKEEQERIKLEKEMEREKLKEDEKRRKKEEQERMKLEEMERKKLKIMSSDKHKVRTEKEDKDRQKEELRRRLEDEKQRKKDEKEMEREKLREEKKRHAERMKLWNKSREDMECEDLKELPCPVPVHTRVPAELFGEVLMVLEFLCTFGELFDLKDEFPDGVSLEILEEALVGSDPEGPLCELLFFFLLAIFQAQTEELEDAAKLQEACDGKTKPTHSVISTVTSLAAAWSQLHQGCNIKKLDLDSCTVSEILRLHIMSSGADCDHGNAKFRYQKQGGFLSTDDPCVELRMANPALLERLGRTVVYDLTPGEKLTILQALCGKMLTLVKARDYIEDNIDKQRIAKQELREIRAEQHRRDREAAHKLREQAEFRKKELKEKLKEDRNSTDHPESLSEQSIEDEDEYNSNHKEDGSNQKEKPQAVSSAIAPVSLTAEELEEEQQKVQELQNCIQKASRRTSLVPLGRDRLYRRYWLFPSTCALFVEDDYFGLTEDMLEPHPISPQDGQTEDEGQQDTQMDTHSPTYIPVSGLPVIRSNQWAFYSLLEEVEQLMEALNPRGHRERSLKEALHQEKDRITQILNNAAAVKYNYTVKAPDSFAPAESVVESRLRDMLLDIEDRIYEGNLGMLKITERETWRSALDRGQYELLAADGRKNGEMNGGEEMEVDDSQPVNSTVRCLAHALFQIEQGIERRFLQVPLGGEESKKDKKNSKNRKKNLGDQSSNSDNGSASGKMVLEHWRESLQSCSSLSQVFVHLSTLDKSIIWAKSLLNARCKLCRRKGDAETMLLCDGCDRGHHLLCLRPRLKSVPEGEWFCPDCRPKQRSVRPVSSRKYSSTDEEVDEEEEEESEEEEEESEWEYESEEEEADEEESSAEEEEPVSSRKRSVTEKLPPSSKSAKRGPKGQQVSSKNSSSARKNSLASKSSGKRATPSSLSKGTPGSKGRPPHGGVRTTSTPSSTQRDSRKTAATDGFPSCKPPSKRSRI